MNTVNAVETSGLTKFYGKTRGIVDLDLQIREGEFFGFIGPNGAGKSTTIRTLLGLIRKDRGTARVLGMDIEKDKERILGEIGYLPSESVFYSGMKVKDILRLSADLHKKDCRKTAEELCMRLQLAPSRKAEELSFGNRKKAAVICALQHEPRLCILDEPTGGLDPLMQIEFFNILKERNSRGMTVFLSSHILSEIQRYCSRAAIIREGRIIASGRVEDLTKTQARRVTVRGDFYKDADPEVFRLQKNGLPADIRDIRKTEDGATFLYSGDINLLLSFFAAHPVRDLVISEPDLEEIFLHYYAEKYAENDNSKDGGDRS